MKATDQIEFKALNNVIDKVREFDERHGWIDYFFAPVLVTTILLTVYAIKGVYPFGLNTIAYYDMPSTISGHTGMWDIVHGNIGLYINWYAGLGISGAGGGGAYWPLNWLFGLGARDNLLFLMSIILLIRLALSAFTMSLYYKKHFRSSTLTVCAGTLYALSGYVIQYYNNIFFTDFVIMLPLVVLALEKLLIENKYIMFVIVMFFVFMLNIQFVFMVCIYIIFKSFFIIRSVPEEKRGRSLRLFLVSIIVSLLLAGFILIPEISTLIKSVRVSGGVESDSTGFDYFDSMKIVYNTYRRHKQFIMYGSEMAVGLLLLVVFKGKYAIRKYADNIILLVILTLPIIHEGINLIWHAGSYRHFPIRFGYMITFECLVFVGTYYRDEEFNKIKYVSKIAKLLGIAAIPFVAYILFKFSEEFTQLGINNLSAYHTYWIYFLTLSAVYFLAFIMETEGARKTALLLTAVIQGFCGCYGFIAPKEGNIDNYRIRWILNSIDMHKQFSEYDNYSERIKLDPMYYDPTDSAIIGQPTISYWSNGINAYTENELQNSMGYDGKATCTLDSGGTVLTDALLGIKRVASFENPDDKIYYDNDKFDKVYECRYTMPFGMVFDIDDINSDSKNLEYNNELFKSITDIDKELINIADADNYVDSERILTEEESQRINDFYIKNGPKDAYITNESSTESESDYSDEKADEKTEENEIAAGENNSTHEFSLKIPCKNLSELYLVADDNFQGDIIIKNGEKPIYDNSFITYGSYSYPNELRNGILALGGYENEDINLTIYTMNKNLEGIKIGLLDLDLLSSGIEDIKKNQSVDAEFNKSHLRITGKANKSGTLFLPLGYSDNWHAKMNGKQIEVRPYINNAFIGIDVNEGELDIEFSYIPKGLIPGILLSISGIIMGTVLIVLEKRGGIQKWKYVGVLDKVFIYGFNTVVAIMFIFMYVVPIWIKMSL